METMKLDKHSFSNQEEVDLVKNAKARSENNFDIKQLMRYKDELEELKTKEVAYKETIEKGDSILNKVSIALFNKMLVC